MAAFVLNSSAFAGGEPIPARYTCSDANLSPPLHWSGTPPGTRSLVLVLECPDAEPGARTRWIVYDIPATRQSLPEALEDQGGLLQGSNEVDGRGYAGPCPPHGTKHRYVFRLLALGIATLGLRAGALAAEVLRAAEPHRLAEARLTGTYSR